MSGRGENWKEEEEKMKRVGGGRWGRKEDAGGVEMWGKIYGGELAQEREMLRKKKKRENQHTIGVDGGNISRKKVKEA